MIETAPEMREIVFDPHVMAAIVCVLLATVAAVVQLMVNLGGKG